mmetsp:Transcript_108769/g.307521  ORF Transcript_108769/g.307521 Transcript_108769/m.307521 type:complete len:204 (+) Transcript_108769:324-935(+)
MNLLYRNCAIAFAFVAMSMASSIRYWNKSMMGLSMKVVMATLIIMFILTTGGLMYSRSVASETPQRPTTSLMRSMMSSIWLSEKKPVSRLWGGGTTISASDGSGFFGLAPQAKPQKVAGRAASSGASWTPSSCIWAAARSGASLSPPSRIHTAPLEKWMRSYLMFALPLITNPVSFSVRVTKRSTFCPPNGLSIFLFSTTICI